MSTSRSWILAISLVLVGCGGGDDGSGGSQPDAASPGAPDASPDPGTPDGGPGISQCENYCSTIMANCAGLTAYADVDQCIASCDALLPQDGAGEDENSVQCRLRHAVEAAASGDKTTACAAAELHGNDTCGAWCEVYCDLMELNCSDQSSSYASRDACLDACAGFATDGDPSLDSGDTVQCRIHHAGIPALRDPVNACGYAAQSPSNYCIDADDIGF
jgi:hypothetical protein